MSMFAGAVSGRDIVGGQGVDVGGGALLGRTVGPLLRSRCRCCVWGGAVLCRAIFGGLCGREIFQAHCK